MKITIHVNQRNVAAHMTSIARTLPQHRRQFVTDIARQLVSRIIFRNPVDTARSRAAWVAALADLQSVAPAGWKGSHPAPQSVTLGLREGEATRDERAHTSIITVSNHVPYIQYVELGTSRSAPALMVRQTLREAPALIARTPLISR